MKAGIMEIADIHVVNKSDLPGACTLTRELKSVLSLRGGTSTWSPKVIEVSSTAATGFDELDATIDEHYDWYRENSDRQAVLRKRIEYQLGVIVSHQLESLLTDTDLDRYRSLAAVYTDVLPRLTKQDS